MAIQPEQKNGKEIHTTLAHSYTVYYTVVLIGLILDLLMPVRLLPDTIATTIGFALILVAPILIIWAQSTSWKHRGARKSGSPDFAKGPYAFLRSPTHLGLDMLVIGFGLFLNSIFIIIFWIASFILSRFVFVKKQEELLEKKYGDHYTRYKETRIRG